MNRKLRPHSSTVPPRGIINRLHAALKLSAMAGALAIASAAPAMADTITFDSLTPATYNSGTTLNSQHFNLLLVEGPFAASLGSVGSTGVVAGANDPFACDIATCPVGASGNYLGVLNDGAVNISLDGTQGIGFILYGLDFAFLAPFGLGDGSYGQLQLNAISTGGAMLSAVLDLPGQNANGDFMFLSSQLNAAFSSSVLSSLTINACVYDQDLVCVNSLSNPAFNQAQFAIDNVRLGVVPEPSTPLLIVFGLAGLGFMARRRAAAPSTPLLAQGIDP